MKKLLLATAALACLGGTALAGPNANGTLIVALAEGVVYTNEIENYCGATGLQDCGLAVAQYDGTDTVVLGVLAAFPPSGSPRLGAISFGWSYTADFTLVASGGCGDFELATDGWPASGEGTAITWGTAQTSSLVDVYWAAGYDYYGNPTSLMLGGHPTQGANFADDDVPSNLDPIAGLGSFGFFQGGEVPCPTAAPGACCFEDGSCEVLLAGDCTGEFLGEGTVCDPNPCEQPAIGACCFDEVCSQLTRTECADQGGEYQGDDIPCDPNPCVIVPTIESSWGEIKSNYR